MTTIGFCTHFTETDEWAFEYALRLARGRGWQLNICHWLYSPYLLRRDLIADDLFHPEKTTAVNPSLLVKLERQLREYYESRLGDFTDVAFKLCEGQYQVELVRCFRKNLLDLVVIGYQAVDDETHSTAQTLEEFALHVPFPLIVVGKDGPHNYLLNEKAREVLDDLDLPDSSWSFLQPVSLAPHQP